MTRLPSIICLTMFFAVPMAVAQDDPPTDEPEVMAVPADEPGNAEPQLAAAPLKFSLSFFGEHAFERDLNDGGDVSTTRTGIQLQYGDRWDERTVYGLSARVVGVYHDFSDPPRLFGGADNAESDLYYVRFGGQVERMIDEEWSWLAGGGLQVSGGKDADVDDSLNGLFFAAGKKQMRDDLSIALGVSVVTRLEDDPLLAPYIGVNWQIDEQTSLVSSVSDVTLRRQMSDSTVLRIFARFEIEEYRFDDDASIPGGILQEIFVDTGLGLDWMATDTVTIGFNGGIRVFDRFKTMDKDGDDFSADRADPTWFLGAQVTMRF